MGDSLVWLRSLADESVDLVVTSPPFALLRQKRYGNKPQDEYIAWLMPFADEVWRVLKPSGSFVLELGSAWNRGSPTKSTYQFAVLLELTDRPDRPFFLAQDFYWYNPARLPSPAQWVTIERTRVKDAVSPVWWLSKSDRPRADNRAVLKEYSKQQIQLFENGYNAGRRHSEHVVSQNGFSKRHAGAIPPNYLPIENVLSLANTSSADRFLRTCREQGLPVHPARFPKDLPEFFIQFLTTEGDVVMDPFGGSNTVGWVAESLKRRWMACEIDPAYAYVSRYRFLPLPRWLLAPPVFASR